MSRTDLTRAVTNKAGIPWKESEIIVVTIFDSIARSLRAGEGVEIRGFGSFRLRQRQQRTGRNIEAMYVDKLDGRVEQELYDRKAVEWGAQQAEVAQQIQEHKKPQEAEVDIWALAQRAVELFQKQPAREKRKLLDCVVARCSWKNGVLTPEWRVPFGMLVPAAA